MEGSPTSVIKRRREQPPAILLDIGGVQSVTMEPNDVFKKRKRHKTREDHYEPNKRVKEKVARDKTERRKRRREEKSGRRRKILKKSGDDLMHAFSSRSVGQDRLTVRFPGVTWYSGVDGL
jgi:hypothetical protein